ncbi:MAG TPA: CarD family transcriptional regulator [Methylocystis sp.]
MAKPVNAAKPAAAAKEPTIKSVEQQKPAAPVAPAAAKPPVVAAEPKSLEKTVASTPLAPAQETPAAPGVGARPPFPARPKPAASSAKPGFKLNEHVVYPAHGVGQIVGVETQEVAGFSLELFVVSFIKDKMILKVPTSKVASVGMRKLAETTVVDRALQTLSGRARVKRTMWSRRAQEYEAKINSGDLITIAEVVRDLYRSDTQPEQSYSERQLYEAALDRMAREIAAVRKLIDSESLKLIESFLLKGPRRGPKAEGEAGDDGGDEADVDRAA